jgi:type I restriction enzyme S subunit
MNSPQQADPSALPCKDALPPAAVPASRQGLGDLLAQLQPYPEYKDTGLPWVGKVPKHWEVRRMKLLLREVDSRSSTGKEQLLCVSQYKRVTKRKLTEGTEAPDTRAFSLVGYERVAPDDLIVNIMLAWNGSLGVSRYEGIVSPAYCVYRFKTGVCPWYYHELLRIPPYKGQIKAASTGVVETRLRLYSDDLGRIEAIQPPRSEQLAIVRFLDWAGGRVERAVRAKRRLIALLQELKQVLIHRAVTGQVDVRTCLPPLADRQGGRQPFQPYPAYKPSGIPWLRQIPEHWEVTRVKNEFKCLNSQTCAAQRHGAGTSEAAALRLLWCVWRH